MAELVQVEPKITKTLLCDEKIFTLDNYLTNEECDEFIKAAETRGFKDSSPSGGGHGRTGREDARTSQFCVLNNQSYADRLWTKVKDFLPPDLTHLSTTAYVNTDKIATETKPITVNPHVRIYKYDVGQQFPEHIDYKMKRRVWKNKKQYEQMTFMTLLIYLNDDFEGGQTGFWTQHDEIGKKEHCRFLRGIENKPHQIVISPKKGTAVINDQNLLHEGMAPTSGIKYVIRTDIIHEREIEISDRIRKYMKEEDFNDREGEWERIFETSCKNYAD